ncbi:MAG: beta-lactamase family protein, partial [Myxococcales bacterium]|nr:beta-lactamase family protein [Myxococcales bacterium]
MRALLLALGPSLLALALACDATGRDVEPREAAPRERLDPPRPGATEEVVEVVEVVEGVEKVGEKVVEKVVEEVVATCLESLASAPTRYEPIVRALCSEHARLGGVGVSLAIAERGALTYRAGVGRRCAGAPAPARAETVYRIGSISKLMTAIIAVELAREGALELDAPITDWLPE